MIHNIFQNRITQEPLSMMRKLKSTYIDMNVDKPKTLTTNNGRWFITLQPNCGVDEVKLEDDFKYILARYYRWKYGSKWIKLKHLQLNWTGIIEKQKGKSNHIHFIINCLDITELSIFLGFIQRLFKDIYPKASHKFEAIYDIDKCLDYINFNDCEKDKHFNKKRIETPSYINSKIFKKAV